MDKKLTSWAKIYKLNEIHETFASITAADSKSLSKSTFKCQSALAAMF
jgi:hypothetical protein